MRFADKPVRLMSAPGQPLTYLHGGGQIVPGLEAALDGLAIGASKQVVVAPEDGYGEHDSSGVQEVPRRSFPPDLQLEVGLQLTASGDQGEFELIVKEIRPDVVIVDLNHPMAGKTLHFDVTVKAVRDATKAELEHGHAHGGDGHHHH